MKEAGGFDNACGTFEDYVQYLKPMGMMLTAPLVIIGLEPPETFRIDVRQVSPNKKEGFVHLLNDGQAN